MEVSAFEFGGEGEERGGGGTLTKLRAELPARDGVPEEELQQALEGRQLLVVRLAVGVPVTSIIAVGLAFLLHAMLAGGVIAASWWVVKSYGEHETWASMNQDGGSGFGGVVELDPAEQAGMAAKGAEALALKPLAAEAPAGNELPAEVKLPEVGWRVTEKSILTEDQVPLIGMAPAVEAPKAVAPSKQSDVPGLLEIVPAGAGKAAANDNGNPDGTAVAAAGSGDDDGPIDLMKPGVGRGKGKGRGNGNELDRGASAVNMEPQILKMGSVPDLPEDLRAKVVGRKVSFEVTVGTDGKASAVKVVQSSGLPEVDALFKQFYLQAKYRPGYEQGRVVEKVGEFGFDFSGG